MTEKDALKERRKISLKAIVIGWLTDIIASTLVVGAILIIAGIIFAASGAGFEQIAEQLNSVGLQIVLYLIGFSFTTFGGYIAARIAKNSELKHAFWMGFLSMLAGIIFLLIMPKPTFRWYQIVLQLLAIPFALLGGYIRTITKKPEVDLIISAEDIKKSKKKKILIGCSIALGSIIVLLAILIFFVFHYLPRKQFEVPSELKNPSILKNSNLFTKSVFSNIILRENQLGDVTDIVLGELDPNPGLELGIAGTRGAVLLDSKNFNIKSAVSFDKMLSNVNIVDVNNDGICEFINRGSWCNDASLIDHNGKTIWTYTGKSGIDDMAAGDIDGNGVREFVVGFNGGGGVHLLDSTGRKQWEKPDGNVWHVELIDVNGDGKLEIVHSNAAGQITIRGKEGNIISRNKPLPYFSDFSLVKWPSKRDKEYVLFSENDIIWLLDFNGKDIAKFDAPKCGNLGHARGVPIKIKSDQPEYFAVVVEFRHWERSILYIYNTSKVLVYQEILPDACSAITAIPIEKPDVETLLVGCKGKVLQYTRRE